MSTLRGIFCSPYPFQADAVVDMIGFPPYILDPQKLHEKYEDVSLPSTQSSLVLVFAKVMLKNDDGHDDDVSDDVD